MADPVAGVDARRHGRAGHPEGVVLELGEGQPDVAVDDGLGVSETDRGVGHQARDRSPSEVAPGILGQVSPGAGRDGSPRSRPLGPMWI